MIDHNVQCTWLEMFLEKLKKELVILWLQQIDRLKKLATFVDSGIRISISALCVIYRIIYQWFSHVDLVAYFANAYKSGITSDYGSIFFTLDITK